jgi:hypothetical protein
VCVVCCVFVCVCVCVCVCLSVSVTPIPENPKAIRTLAFFFLESTVRFFLRGWLGGFLIWEVGRVRRARASLSALGVGGKRGLLYYLDLDLLDLLFSLLIRG